MIKNKKSDLKDNPIILGIDPSLNGSCFLLMKDFKVINYFYFTNIKSNSKNKHAIYLKSDGIKRLEKIYDWYKNFINTTEIDYMAIENYSFGSKSNSVYQIGGLGEMIRLLTYKKGIPFKEYEPSKIKMFATSNGNAEKSQMVLSAYKENFDLSKYNKSAEDIADAFWIARFLSVELILRKDKSLLNSLKKHQRESFLRTTKKEPIPILNRPFILNRG